MATEFADRVTFGKVNVDDQDALARRFHIASIPTVAVFRDGKLIDRQVGVRPAPIYRKALDAALQPVAAASATAPKSAPKHSVTVFSTPTCPWCSKLKSYLREHQVAFKEVDVSVDDRAAKQMVQRSGQMGVPQAWIDGQTIVGFDRKRIDALLGIINAGKKHGRTWQ